MIICPTCLAENKDDAEYCVSCGADIPKFELKNDSIDLDATVNIRDVRTQSNLAGKDAETRSIAGIMPIIQPQPAYAQQTPKPVSSYPGAFPVQQPQQRNPADPIFPVNPPVKAGTSHAVTGSTEAQPSPDAKLSSAGQSPVHFHRAPQNQTAFRNPGGYVTSGHPVSDVSYNPNPGLNERQVSDQASNSQNPVNTQPPLTQQRSMNEQTGISPPANQYARTGDIGNIPSDYQRAQQEWQRRNTPVMQGAPIPQPVHENTRASALQRQAIPVFNAGRSPAFLIAVILTSILTAIPMFTSFSSGGAVNGLLSTVLGTVGLDGLMYFSSGLSGISFLLTLISYLPQILVIIGLWVAYAGSYSYMNSRTAAGCKIIKVIYILNCVFTCIGLAVLLIVMIGASSAAGEMLGESSEMNLAGLLPLVGIILVILYYSVIVAAINRAIQACETGYAEPISGFAVFLIMGGGIMKAIGALFAIAGGGIITQLLYSVGGSILGGLASTLFPSVWFSLFDATAYILFAAVMIQYNSNIRRTQ